MISTLLVGAFYPMIKYASVNDCGYGSSRSLEAPPKVCGSSWKFYLSLANNNSVSFDQGILLLSGLNSLIIYGFIYYYSWKIFKSEIARTQTFRQESGLRGKSMGSYAVQLVNLPMGISLNEIANFFEQRFGVEEKELWPHSESPVLRIVPLFREMRWVTEMDLRIRQLVKQYAALKLQKQKEERLKVLKELTVVIQMAEAKLDLQYSLPVKNSIQSSYLLKASGMTAHTRSRIGGYKSPQLGSLFCRRAIVILKSSALRDHILQKMSIKGLAKYSYLLIGRIPDFLVKRNTGNRHTIKKVKLQDGKSQEEQDFFYVVRAKSPQDMMWQNLGLSPPSRTVKRILSTLASIAILLGSLVVSILLKKSKIDLENESSFWRVGGGLVLSLVIKGFNFAYTIFTDVVVEFEQLETRTDRLIKITHRNTLVGLSLTVVCIPKQYLDPSLSKLLGMAEPIRSKNVD